MNYPKILKSNTFYFTGLLLLVAGLPVSLFLTSISQFILIAAFIAEGNPVEKIKRFYSNKAAVLISGIWVMHLFGLLWTTDLNEGLKDLRIKLPLLLLPVIIAGSKPLSSKQFNAVLLVFVCSVFAGSMVSMAVLNGIIERNINDIRDIFIFNISHIRFALFICLSVFILVWLLIRKGNEMNFLLKVFSVLLIVWFILFLVIMESVTGLLILSAIVLLLLLYHAFTSGELRFKIIMISIVILLPLTFFFILDKFVSDFYSNQPYRININDKTSLGNDYSFSSEDPLYENGFPVWVYVCEKELRDEWNKKSKLNYDSADERRQPLKYTLIRFLSSKGLRKDAEGFNKLSPEEIRSVEKGIANVNYQELSNLKERFRRIMWEFDQLVKGRNSGGHSVTQRFEFWKAGWGIARENFFTGAGTGDLREFYRLQYIKMQTTLKEEYRLRAHNQYLSIFAAFGIFGLIYFLYALFYPLVVYKRRSGFLFTVFFLIAFFSMFTEDTLETQAGATFIALFFPLLLFSKPADKKDR